MDHTGSGKGLSSPSNAGHETKAIRPGRANCDSGESSFVMYRHLRRRAALVVLILVMSFVGFGATTASAATGTLTGHLTDNGVPVGGVQVNVMSVDFSVVRSIFTDPDGGYRFDDLPSGDYRLSFLFTGFTQYAHQKL